MYLKSECSIDCNAKGGILSGDAAEETKDVLLLDVASLSLGIEVRGVDVHVDVDVDAARHATAVLSLRVEVRRCTCRSSHVLRETRHCCPRAFEAADVDRC